MPSSTNHLAKLAQHLEWADELCLDSLRKCRTPLPAAIGLYAHILAAENAWFSRIEGVVPAVAVWPEMALDECETLGKQVVDRLQKLLAGLSADDLQKQITYRNSAGNQFTTGLEDILLHVFLHGSYHRGQVAALLRSAGDVPNPTDYIGWVRGAPAATRTKS